MPRRCINNANNFCYICGKVTFAAQKKTISPIVRKAYHLYFGCKIGNQDKDWAPHICCHTCAVNLSQWLNGKRKAMPFGVPMIWREPTNHIDDCYFCMVPPVSGGITKKKKRTVEYPNIPSALWPACIVKVSLSQCLRQIFLSVYMRKIALHLRILLNFHRHHVVPLWMIRSRALVKHLCHIKLPQMNWTILFAIWTLPKPNLKYWPQDFNSEIFSKKMSEWLHFAAVISSSHLSLKRKKVLSSAAILKAYYSILALHMNPINGGCL